MALSLTHSWLIREFACLTRHVVHGDVRAVQRVRQPGDTAAAMTGTHQQGGFNTHK